MKEPIQLQSVLQHHVPHVRLAHSKMILAPQTAGCAQREPFRRAQESSRSPTAQAAMEVCMLAKGRRPAQAASPASTLFSEGRKTSRRASGASLGHILYRISCGLAVRTVSKLVPPCSRPPCLGTMHGLGRTGSRPTFSRAASR